LADIFLNTIGTTLDVEIQDYDVADATAYHFIIKRPDDTYIRGPATGDCQIGDHNNLWYAVISGDVNQVGTYYFQVYLEFSNWRGRSNKLDFHGIDNV